MSIEGASLSDDGMLSLVSRNKSATSEPLAPVIFTWKPQSQSSLQLENHQPGKNLFYSVEFIYLFIYFVCNSFFFL